MEKGIDYWYPNPLWILLVVLLGGISNLVFFFVIPWHRVVTDRMECTIYFAVAHLSNVIWGGGFFIIGVWKAGMVVIITTGPLLFGIPLLVHIGCFILAWRHESRMKSGYLPWCSWCRTAETPPFRRSIDVDTSYSMVNLNDRETSFLSAEKVEEGISDPLPFADTQIDRQKDFETARQDNEKATKTNPATKIEEGLCVREQLCFADLYTPAAQEHILTSGNPTTTDVAQAERCSTLSQID